MDVMLYIICSQGHFKKIMTMMQKVIPLVFKMFNNWIGICCHLYYRFEKVDAHFVWKTLRLELWNKTSINLGTCVWNSILLWEKNS
jgi:hypothetical protein